MSPHLPTTGPRVLDPVDWRSAVAPSDASKTTEPGLQTSSFRSQVNRLLEWPALLGAGLTFIVAVLGLSRPSLWFDEAATISGANRGFRSYTELMASVDAVHGLYYLIMMPWTALFGTSAWTIRFPSAVVLSVAAFFTVKIAMIYARAVVPVLAARAGVVAGVLFAVLPGLTWMGHDARGYPFGVACVVLAWWSYERWLDSRDDRWLVLLVLSHLGGIYFTLYAAMVVPLYVLRALGHGRVRAGKAAGAAVLLGVGTLPLIIVALPQQGQIAWISTSTPEVIRRMATSQFFMGQRNLDAPWHESLLGLAWLLCGLSVVITVMGLLRGPARGIQVWLGAWILTPMVLLIGIHLAGGQYYDERYVVFTGPALVVLLAIVLTICLPKWRRDWIIVGLVVALCLPAVLAQHGKTSKFGSDYRTASAFLEPADTIYFADPASRGFIMAYPHETPAEDPLLATPARDSGTLWGINQPLESVLTEVPSGRVGVTTPNAHDHALLVDHLTASGCEVSATLPGGRNRSTLLQCSLR